MESTPKRARTPNPRFAENVATAEDFAKAIGKPKKEDVATLDKLSDRSKYDEEGYLKFFGPGDLVRLHVQKDVATPSATLHDPPVSFEKQLCIVSSSKSFRLVSESGLKANSQCAHVISDAVEQDNPTPLPIDDPNYDPDPPKGCWLCGKPLLDDKGYGIDFDGKYATNECDHVIPAAASVMFYDILIDVNEFTDKSIRDFFAINYFWTHPFCNKQKADRLFFKITKSDGSIDYRGISDKNVDEYISQKLNLQGLDFDKSKSNIMKNLKPLHDYFTKAGPDGLKVQMTKNSEKLKKNVDFIYTKLMYERPNSPYYKRITDAIGQKLDPSRLLTRENYNDYYFMVHDPANPKTLQQLKEYKDEQKRLIEEARKGLIVENKTPSKKRARGSGKTKRRKGGKKRTKRIHKKRK
jgi:hypothetical protein